MSDLDKAIRTRLERVRANMSAHYAIHDDGRIDPVWNDAGELAGAVQQLLDWANDLETDFEGAESVVGKAFGNQIRRLLADSLGVSGEDRSEPTPATRVWRAGDRAAHAGIPGRITFVGGTTAPWEFTPDHGDAFRFYNATALSEVVSPEGTS